MNVILVLSLFAALEHSKGEACSDQSEHCPSWESSGYCDSTSDYFDYMKDKCPDTCGFCKGDPVCVDEYVTCEEWAKEGYCSKGSAFDPWMADNCKKTCGVCKAQPTLLPPTTQQVTSALPPDCQDKSSYCSSYKEYCTDAGYIDYLKVECKRTCRYCWVTTPRPPTTLSSQPYTGSGGRKIQPNCGNNDKSKDRIVGGKNALPGAWPWQVSMDWLNNEANPGHMCGGTLITEEWVLTAAHCFVNDKNKDNYWLTLGQHNIKKKSGREQVFNISQLIFHPKYNTDNQDYDMALMKLKGKARLNDYVRTACLPGQHTTFTPGTMCYITGWGLLSEYGEGPAILQQAKVPLVSRSVCETTYRRIDYDITHRMICAGYENGKIDSCEGDSGGPLACNEKDAKGKDIWYLWGAISWGVGCARRGRYGVLSSTKVLRPWIDEIVFNGHVE